MSNVKLQNKNILVSYYLVLVIIWQTYVHCRKKSIGIIRKIFTKLHSLNLQQYYFEGGMTFMNVMLRSSILYACETYYNLKETEIRQIERIEESFMRQLIETTKGCPINQIYLELGHPPARYDITS